MTNSVYPDVALFIGNRRILANERDTIASINPATGEELGKIPRATLKDIDDAFRAANEAFAVWSELSGVQRSNFMMRVAENLKARAEEIAHMITLDLGKPLNRIPY